MLGFVIHILVTLAIYKISLPLLLQLSRSFAPNCIGLCRKKTPRITDKHFFPDVRIIELIAEHGIYLMAFIHLAGVKSC